MTELRRIVMLRHPLIVESWRQRCYGSSDVALAEPWVLPELPKDFIPQVIYSSTLLRAIVVASAFANVFRVEHTQDDRLNERDFGAWEGETWDEIYRTTGEEMMGMVSHPESWRPPGGETTFELRDRVLAWYQTLPSTGEILAVAHGGPIAALVGTSRGQPVVEWPTLIPKHNTFVELA